jgi:uncharacterized SAM-binding protein YcdF (DUF218 family)
MNAFFKLFILMVAVCLIVTFFGMYKNETRDRFNISTDGAMFSDTKTNDVYILTESGSAQKYKWLKFDKTGHETVVKELPR